MNIIEMLEETELDIGVISQKRYDYLNEYGRGHHEGCLNVLAWLLRTIKSDRRVEHIMSSTEAPKYIRFMK